MEELRSALYFLGFLANFLFAARFLLQWIQSEKKGTSVVPRLFWQLSLGANVLMCVHGYIQLQYPICLIQALNAIISWRNLNLMGKKSYSLKTPLFLMAFAGAAVSLLFWLQTDREWMRPPTLPWNGLQGPKASLLWHILGFSGMLLFASRYWIQWGLAEKHKKSFLGKSFWWVSCIGASFSLVYSIRLIDPVNILGFSVGLIPYVRNLMLLKKAKERLSHSTSSSLFIFAGEQSGDVLGAELVRALQSSSSLTLYGVGGPEMQKAGLKVIHPMERFQVMGFSDVIKSLPRLYKDFKKIQKEILTQRPAGVLLIDYPDFNMRLAKSLRKKGYKGKVIHYVCPSVWAWRKKRVFSLAKTLDLLLSIFPFEEKCFVNTKLAITYVGHPLVSVIHNYTYDPFWTNKKPLIAIFPGSRKHEIERNLPLQIAAAKKLGPHYTLAISVARPHLQDLIQKHVDPTMLLVPSDKRYELMRAAQCAIATSGTIVLELGLHGVPTVVSYQLSKLNYLLGRYIFRIRLPFYTLVNIICEKQVYPEFIHKKLSSEEVFQALKKLMDNPKPCKQECEKLRALLTNENASLKAATIISEALG